MGSSQENEATEREIDGKPYHWNTENCLWFKSKTNHHQANVSLLANNITSSAPTKIQIQDHDLQATSHYVLTFPILWD